MKLLSGVLLAVAGVGLMAGTYFRYVRLDPAVSWSSGLMYVAAGPADALPADVPFPHAAATIRPLPGNPLAAALVSSLGSQSAVRRRGLAAQLCEKLLLLGPEAARLDDGLLVAGRMPRAGQDEVLAGYQTTARERLPAAGREFRVVGVLRRDVALLSDCYLLPPHGDVAALFGPEQADAHAAMLVQLTAAESHERPARDRLKELFPAAQYAAVTAAARAERGPYYLYLAGEALLLVGGSLALIALYRLLSRRIAWRVLRDPLEELAARPKLLGTLHGLYFGLVLAASLAVYELPMLQTALISTLRQAFTEPQNPLGVVAEAYSSRHIPWAAAVTLAVNFFGGSLAVITLPSLIVPGSGVLMALLRATMWGLLLAPTLVALSFGMLAHDGTLLLEGEAYILATFFGLLMPIYLFRHDPQASPWRRYLRGLRINCQAQLLVALVLALAACYEATEVILMSR